MADTSNTPEPITPPPDMLKKLAELLPLSVSTASEPLPEDLRVYRSTREEHSMVTIPIDLIDLINKERIRRLRSEFGETKFPPTTSTE